MDASTLKLIILPAGLIAVLFALYLARDVLRRDTGTKEMQDVAGTIFEGAVAFIRRQYSTIGIFALVGSVVITGVITALVTHAGGRHPVQRLRPRLADGHRVPGRAPPARWPPGSSACSSASRPTCAPPRPPGAACVEAVQVAMRGGAVSGFLVVALSLLGVYGMFVAFGGFDHPEEAPFLIVGFGFGASFVALFAQLGGGIYTKAADVGSDLVGKVEAGIPEDDPRNAGVIADLVGDNVGDCAGRGADLFESTAAENIGAMILGVAVYTIAKAAGWAHPEAWIFFPLVVRAFGLLVDDRRDLLRPRSRGRGPDEHAQPGLLGDDRSSSVVGLAHHDLRDDADRAPRAAPSGLPDLGLVLRRRRGRPGHQRRLRLHHPVLHGRLVPARSRRSPRPRKTGPATNIISGVAVGFETTVVTAITIGIALFASHWLGSQAGLIDANGTNVGGIFGTAVATMGMLMTTAYILAMDTFGPITDNAGGIAEFSRAEAGAREITDRLDAVGNTTKALTKGYAIASASLAAFLLFSAYIDKINLILGRQIAAGQADVKLLTSVDLSNVQRVHRRAPGGDAGLLLQLAGDPRGRQDGPVDHRRGPPPVPRDARDHGLHPAPGLRPGRRHHHPGRPARDGPAGRGGRRHADHRRRRCSATRRSPAC